MTKFRLLVAMIAALLAIQIAPAAASPNDEIARLVPMWRANAPLCEGAPSSEDCEDGDMTLFNGLLCAVGEPLGCKAVADAQGSDGRWYRSPRLARNPDLKPQNSFSWDMALGVQLYSVTTGDKAALERWLGWIENHRPCLVQSPKLDGNQICLVKGWPRWCPDDTEKGCTAKPQDLAMLTETVETLGAKIPEPAKPRIPSGWSGPILRRAAEESSEANAELSLGNLLRRAKGLHPDVLLVDAGVNREGFPRHLVGTSILLLRRLGKGSPKVNMAANILATREPENPFFLWLSEGPTPTVAARVLVLAPKSQADIPAERRDWSWQRAITDQAWTRSNLWDFLFMSRALGVGEAKDIPE